MMVAKLRAAVPRVGAILTAGLVVTAVLVGSAGDAYGICGRKACVCPSCGSGGGSWAGGADSSVFFDNLANWLDKIFSRPKKTPKHIRRSAELAQKARTYSQQGDYGNAILYFKKALKADPKDTRGWLKASVAWNQARLTEQLWARADYIGALEHLRAAAKYDAAAYGQSIPLLTEWANLQQGMRDQAPEGRRIVRRALREDVRYEPEAPKTVATFDFNVTKANVLAAIRRGGDLTGDPAGNASNSPFGIAGTPDKDLDIELLPDGAGTTRETVTNDALRQAESAAHHAGSAMAAARQGLRQYAQREAGKPFDRSGKIVDQGIRMGGDESSSGDVVDTRGIEPREVPAVLKEKPQWQALERRETRLDDELSRKRERIAGMERRLAETRDRLAKPEIGKFQVRIAVQKQKTSRVEQQLAAVKSEKERILDSWTIDFGERGTNGEDNSTEGSPIPSPADE